MTRSVERWAAQIQCDALADEERRQQARAEQQSFQLHVQFVRAHGLPKGEVTLFSNGGGVWSPGVDRLL